MIAHLRAEESCNHGAARKLGGRRAYRRSDELCRQGSAPQQSVLAFPGTFFQAEYPDGRKEELLNIAKYNYNWQLDYQLQEPKLLPAGTKITAIAAFDN